MFIKHILFVTFIFFFAISNAKELKTIELPSGEETEVRVFSAKGNILLIGFACDNGKSKHEEATAISLAEDGIEVWMPDMLSTYMLPKSRSSYEQIPSEDLTHIIYEAISTNKDVYIVGSGPDTQLLLRVAAHWKKSYPDYHDLKGAILLFPRLNDGEPEPGVEPKYVKSVGITTIPLMVLEGGRTPNRWGVDHLTKKLGASGSNVVSKIVPGVRGYFFKRGDPNRTEDVVTSQLSGLIKVSLFYLQELKK
jgi:hypothetical protein